MRSPAPAASQRQGTVSEASGATESSVSGDGASLAVGEEVSEGAEVVVTGVDVVGGAD